MSLSENSWDHSIVLGRVSGEISDRVQSPVGGCRRDAMVGTLTGLADIGEKGGSFYRDGSNGKLQATLSGNYVPVDVATIPE